MADEIDNVAELVEREAERFAAALRAQRAQRERGVPVTAECRSCGEPLEGHRKAYGLCFPCAARAERRRI